MTARKSIKKPKADKQIKVPAKAKAPEVKRINIASIGGVKMQDGLAVIVVDGKEETVKCAKASIVFEG